MKKCSRTLAMILVLVMFFGLVGPAGGFVPGAYAEELASAEGSVERTDNETAGDNNKQIPGDDGGKAIANDGAADLNTAKTVEQHVTQVEQLAVQTEQTAVQVEQLAVQTGQTAVQAEQTVMQTEQIVEQTEQIVEQTEQTAVQAEQTVMQTEQIVEQTEQGSDAVTIVYDVVETKAKGSLYGEMPSVVGDEEQQVNSGDTVTISELDATSYQTFTGNEKDRFPYYSYAFKGWMTEGGEIVTPGSDVEVTELDSDGDGVAALSSVWSGSWASGSGTPFAKFSLWTNAMSANDCFESGTLLGESVSSYTPAVGGSIMVALDDEGNTVTPDELASPSHGGAGKPNVGEIYNNPELSFKENNQGKYMMVSYMNSSISQADEDIRTLASTGLHTSDSETGDVTWKLDELPSDEEVLARVSSFVSRGMTTMRDENGQRIAADDLTTENYSVLWCQVKYQSGKNDGWNINGVLSTKVKELQNMVTEIIEEIEAEPEVEEIEAEPEVEEIKTEPEVEEIKTEPEVKEIEAEPAAEEIKAKPAAEEIKAEPAAEEIKAELAAEEIKTVPLIVNTPAAPAVEEGTEQTTAAVSAGTDPHGGVSNGRQTLSLAAEHIERPVVEEIAENEVPFASFAATGEGRGSWSLVDMILLILSLYILLPLFSMKEKYGRMNESAYGRRLALSSAGELLLAVLALAVIGATQSFGGAMTIVDEVTPLMAALCAVGCGIEYGLRKARRSLKAES